MRMKHISSLSESAPIQHNQTHQINQQKNSIFSGTFNHEITPSPKVTAKKKNIIHSWKKKRGWGENISSIPRDTKIVHHQSLKEY